MKILRALDFVPDSLMLRLQYFIKTGRLLHLKNPQRYTEKLQWYKLNYKDPLMAQCVDKYEVRKYVEKCGLGHILNECYGVFERVEDIDFDKLPTSFVLKDTLGGGGNDVIIVRNKQQADLNTIKKRLTEWLARPSTGKDVAREWVYAHKKHRIIIEKYLTDSTQPNGIVDYKFFCFNGKVFCSYLLKPSTFSHLGELAFFNRDFVPLHVFRPQYAKPLTSIEKEPVNYRKMLAFCEVLALPFPTVRVDFYNLAGQIIFGELTFFTASGYMTFEPDEFDFTLGKQFKLETWQSK